MIRGKLTFKNNPPTRAIAQVEAIPRKIYDAVNAEMRAIASAMAKWAKDNHPWTNRTGDAERGLTGYHGAYGGAAAAFGKVVHYVAIRHGKDVFYGIYLETMAGGKWGVIQRTMEHFQREISRRIQVAINGAL